MNLSIKIALQQQIQNIRGLSEPLDALLAGLRVDQIAIEQLRDRYPIGYRSPMALKLASQTSQTPLEVASSLLAKLSPVEDFTLSISPCGWLQWIGCDRAIANWLQANLLCPMTIHPSWQIPQITINSHSPQVFVWQATHARCCTLLRLGSQQVEFAPYFSGEKPSLIPWLRGETFQLNHPAEHAVIHRLIEIVDTLTMAPSRPSKSRIAQLTGQLSQDWSQCDRHCRIWGSVMRENLILSLGRLGLIKVVQQTLQCLLEKGLGICAPCQL